MRVLRSNKESVTAMLEAFVHDPLINWRLLNTTDAATEAALGRTGGDHAEAGGAPGAGGEVGPFAPKGWGAGGGGRQGQGGCSTGQAGLLTRQQPLSVSMYSPVVACCMLL